MGTGKGGCTVIEVGDLQEMRQKAEEAAATLACMTYEFGQDSCTMDVCGMRSDGQDIGDWTVMVVRKSASTLH